MDPKPLLCSIITAALNPGPEVRQTIESVRGQCDIDQQYIFVDGGSRSECFAHVEPYLPHINCLIREPDEGISDAWNKALALAEVDVIGLINADDFLLPGELKHVGAACGTRTGMQVVHGNAKRIEGNRVFVRRPMALPLPLAMRIGTPVVHPATFVSRYVYRRVGVFDKRYRLAMDYDFVLRAPMADAHFQYIDETLVGFRGGGLSDREPLVGFRKPRGSQLKNGLNRVTTEVLHAAKMATRRHVRPLLGLNSWTRPCLRAQRLAT